MGRGGGRVLFFYGAIDSFNSISDQFGTDIGLWDRNQDWFLMINILSK